jgi:hypothetical protein
MAKDEELAADAEQARNCLADYPIEYRPRTAYRTRYR